MNRTFWAALAAATAATGTGAAAQTAAGPSPLAPLYACADKTDPAERLACFDAAVAAVKAQENRSEIVTFDRKRVETVRREAFGFRLPSLPRLGLPGRDPSSTSAAGEEIEEQMLAVTRLSTREGRATMTMDNGQVWRLTEPGEINAPARTPFNVRIRSATLGSYIMSVEGRNKGYRVRRVE